VQHPEKVLPSDDPQYHTQLQVGYLGAGGFLLRCRNSAILTAPFFSNPSLKRVALWRVSPNHDQIDRRMALLRGSLDQVGAILVGHAHYDHLMDIPYIATAYAPGATIFGNQTMAHILASALPEERLFPLNSQVGQWQSAGNDRIRFMALQSDHAPHFVRVKVFGGGYDTDLEKLPARASGWREGQTFAYLIDFLGEDKKTVEFRIHYQDAVSSSPPPYPSDLSGLEARRVDVALLCVPGFDQVEDYPETLLQQLNPRTVILAHWENLFAPFPEDSRNLRTVPGTDIKRFLERFEDALPADADYWMPAPGAWLSLPPNPSPKSASPLPH
jgi:L-ascorbate metabolism protein UlaG (beta-lactamase superfamily)